MEQQRRSETGEGRGDCVAKVQVQVKRLSGMSSINFPLNSKQAKKGKKREKEEEKTKTENGEKAKKTSGA